MRILLLPGIWPPDIGGPATHGPDFARFLLDRGHRVQVVTMADSVNGLPATCAPTSFASRNGTIRTVTGSDDTPRATAA